MADGTLTAEEIVLLYERHAPALAAYACCYGLNFASAEDAVQQVFLRLLREPVALPKTPVAYLYRAVRNRALNLRRAGNREATLTGTEQWFTRAGAPIEEILSLQNALRNLPEEQREMVFFRVWGGMTFEEISEAIDVPPNTAASRYRYALEKLRETLTGPSRE